MSAEEEAAAAEDIICCASCGQAEIDDIKLKKCACELVKYCSVVCQKNHRPQHKKMCKKQMAELRDKDLFTQPERSCYGDCPICCLPQPIEMRKSTMMPCCSSLICNGCNIANQEREIKGGLERRCAFCREPQAKSQEEVNKNRMERVKKNDPVALRGMGKMCHSEGDYEGALDYLTKAAELGDAGAHYEVSVMYRKGQGVEKDMKKEVYHLEQAAIGGHPNARFNLGCAEYENGRYEIAKKHFIIAANLGLHDSLDNLKLIYAIGLASKEEYAAALRAYQAAVDATKSPEREKVEEAIKNGELKTFT